MKGFQMFLKAEVFFPLFIKVKLFRLKTEEGKEGSTCLPLLVLRVTSSPGNTKTDLYNSK